MEKGHSLAVLLTVLPMSDEQMSASYVILNRRLRDVHRRLTALHYLAEWQL